MSANPAKPIQICFVCLGNICRSPTAEGIMLKLVRDAGLSERVVIDSAGTGAYHVGEKADSRSRAEAKRRGVDLPSVARHFEPQDFGRFDYVIAMDRRNQQHLERYARTPADRSKLHLLRSFDPAHPEDLEVPDPYHGGDDGFARVFDICEAGCRGLLAHVRKVYAL
jgi:protein-tyrosine phosphatase